MERVAIVGCGGTGKTTTARRLGELTGLPVTHLDHLYWRPGWEPAPDDEFRAAVDAVASGSRWIIDGNYGSTADLRFPRADTIIFLDLPRWRFLPAVARRTLPHLGRAVQAPGCPERLDPVFLRYLWTWPTAGRPRLVRHLGRHGDRAALVRLRSRAAIDGFLAGVAAQR